MINSIMDYTILLTTKNHNKHYLNRYLRFIKYCKITNLNSPIKDLINHHICPKAKDLFPEYSNLAHNLWNKIQLTHRQHYIAHFLLWKTYHGSQTNAFYAMNNKDKMSTRLTSRTYELLKMESTTLVSRINKGYAVYVDNAGTKIRCKTDDPRVLTGEIRSTSYGRKYRPRTPDSKLRTSLSVTGKNTGPMSIDERIQRRKKTQILELYYDSYNKIFVSEDPLLVPTHYVKVFTGRRKVWDHAGKFRNIAEYIPVPPGYYEYNPTKIIRGVCLDTNLYVECTYISKPSNFHELSLCKVGKQLFRCTDLNKNVYLPKDFLKLIGLPDNCVPA